jgi:hypothetical protein
MEQGNGEFIYIVCARSDGFHVESTQVKRTRDLRQRERESGGCCGEAVRRCGNEGQKGQAAHSSRRRIQTLCAAYQIACRSLASEKTRNTTSQDS